MNTVARNQSSRRPGASQASSLSILPLILVALALGSCSKQPLVIGFIAPLTGSSANIGVEGLKGARMALAEINKAGGIRGRQVELAVKDDQGDPAKSRAAVQELEAAGRSIIILHTTSGAAKDAIAYAKESPVLLMSRTVTDPRWAGMDDNFLRFTTSAEDFGTTLNGFVKERNETEVAYIIDARNQAYGEAVIAPLLRDAAITSKGRLISDAKSRAEDLAAWAAGTGAKALMAVLAGVDAARLAQALERAGFKGSLYLAPWAQDQNLLAYAGAFAGNIYLPSSFNPDDQSPGYLAFKARYQALYGEDPVMSGVYGYEIIQFLTAGSKKAKSLSPADLRAAIVDTADYEGIQYTFTLDRNGDMRLPAFMLGIEKGAYKAVK